MKQSILQDKKECFVCGFPFDLHLHHVFYGTANRKLSDADGCVIYLCQFHHTGVQGVHYQHKLDLIIKEQCQKAWQETYNKTTEDFIARYGRSYL